MLGVTDKEGNIYNSRNYWSILATKGFATKDVESTIVEIIEAY